MPALPPLPDASEWTDAPAWPVFLSAVPIAFARRHRLLGVTGPEGRPLLLCDRDGDSDALDAVRRKVGPVPRHPVDPALLSGAIDRAYGEQAAETSGAAAAAIAAVDARPATVAGAAAAIEDLLDATGRAPVVTLVNALLFEAVRLEASDVHLQPTYAASGQADGGRTAVRLRCDGVLFDAFDLPGAAHDELVSRFKIIGGMDIAEKQLPQDGRASVRLGERPIDLRLSVVPTQHGERVVVRLLDKDALRHGLDELGMPGQTRARFDALIRREHGLLLVTGPTGSGKSTTLYGALQRIDSKRLNVLTLEDPIEYRLPGISQMQVATQRGMSFAKGLRSVLRQDPDIVMVGEIRDRETAELAIQAALTGHLVFSTLHTNDAASAVTRLVDLGVEPYLVASALLGVMAQRLVRRVCPDCARPAPDDPVAQLGAATETADRPQVGAGCDACRHTGYRGRVGLFELMPVSAGLREEIGRGVSSDALKRTALATGMKTLRDDGVAKVRRGETTAEEVLRVTTSLSDEDPAALLPPAY